MIKATIGTLFQALAAYERDRQSQQYPWEMGTNEEKLRNFLKTRNDEVEIPPEIEKVLESTKLILGRYRN